ncbi:MAG: peptide deformylase [Emcibacter sp.]|nr:peptide deformylase [Emcibacter sp.]
MPALSLILGPHPIFSEKAKAVTEFDEQLQTITQDMIATLYVERAVGIGANMVGILKRIIVLDLQENSIADPQIYINPEIIKTSHDTQCHEEASVCFPGISAKITRPRTITLHYQDLSGASHEITVEDYPATVIQHEIDYLEGKIFLDYLSPIKRHMLLKKTLKFQKRGSQPLKYI